MNEEKELSIVLLVTESSNKNINAGIEVYCSQNAKFEEAQTQG